jgi:hypothetical protein
MTSKLDNTSVAKGPRQRAGEKGKHTDEDEVEGILCSSVFEVVSGVAELLHGFGSGAGDEGVLGGGTEFDEGESEITEHESHQGL